MKYCFIKIKIDQNWVFFSDSVAHQSHNQSRLAEKVQQRPAFPSRDQMRPDISTTAALQRFIHHHLFQGPAGRTSPRFKRTQAWPAGRTYSSAARGPDFPTLRTYSSAARGPSSTIYTLE